ncbi:serine/threonine-protein kinase [Fonticella tunisiensis]|uniref:non-specific serine/threonine protein kinase n=1 Tax=Fonticella tunisiensis TaxID=1096341 RepID=A0A4V3ETN5_9CLOT|nr:serine/threonine-protein kinase [Fonticella tunisiensis]TDT63285.1 serine/threonine protein kinase [Fonticella tunisiensis]
MLKPGDILDGKYEVIRVLGQGGMGIVYLCVNKRLGNLWAIKEIKNELKERIDFLAEPNILKKLSHPGIPRIVDIFNEGDNLYIVEDYIEGETLEKLVLREGRLSRERIYDIASELCDILSYLHSFNPPIIYRDLKPSNIIISPDGKAKLIDFGISRIYKENQSSDTILMGSRGYAAPEQYTGVQSNKQTDIYGLGATLYFMASGEVPPMVIDISRDKNNIDENLGKIIEKAMRTNISERYSTVEELKHELNVLKDENKTFFIDDYKKTETKTMVMEDNSPFELKKKRDKKGLVKALAGFAALVFIIYSLLHVIPWQDKKEKTASMDNKNSISDNKPQESSQQKESPSVNKNNEVKHVASDASVEGLFYWDSPVVKKTSDKDDDRSKGRGKYKYLEDHETESLLYKLNPAALNGKYDNKVTLKLEYMEFTEKQIIAYCVVESSLLNGLIISRDKTYLMGDDGRYSKASLISPGGTSISGGLKKQNIKIVFNRLDLNTDRIILKSTISLKDVPDSTENINLVVNVK